MLFTSVCHCVMMRSPVKPHQQQYPTAAFRSKHILRVLGITQQDLEHCEKTSEYNEKAVLGISSWASIYIINLGSNCCKTLNPVYLLYGRWKWLIRSARHFWRVCSRSGHRHCPAQCWRSWSWQKRWRNPISLKSTLAWTSSTSLSQMHSCWVARLHWSWSSWRSTKRCCCWSTMLFGWKADHCFGAEAVGVSACGAQAAEGSGLAPA